MSTGKRRGRPPGVSYPGRLAIRVTGEQRLAMERAADLEGISLSDWMRRALELAARQTLGGGDNGKED